MLKRKLQYKFARFAAGIAVMALLAGCHGAENGRTADENNRPVDENSQQAEADRQSADENGRSADENSQSAEVNSQLAKENQLVSGSESVTEITGNGDSITVAGSGADISGGTVTISAGGIYRLSGTVNDGQIVIDAGKEDEITLILAGFTISSSESSAILGIQSGKITISPEKGTENTVSDSSSYQYQEGEKEPDAAIFSKDDLVLEGEGTLKVNGNYQDGIHGKDDVTVRSGTYIIDAENDGVKGKDSVEIYGGTFQITAGSDGIQSNNDTDEEKGCITVADGTIVITAGKKGILAETDIEIQGGSITVDSQDDAIHTNGDVRITGGTMNLSTGDDAVHADKNVTVEGGIISIVKSYEGLEGLSVDINGGTVSLRSEDDGINAAGGSDASGSGGRFGDSPFAVTEGAYIRITGGEVKIDAGGDGIDSNGDLWIEGGSVVVEGPVDDGNGTLDYNGTGLITGGTFTGTGSSGMLQAFSEESTQPVLIICYDGKKDAGTEITVTDGEQNVMAAVTPGKEFTSFIFSSPELTEGETYQIVTGDEKNEMTITGIVNQSGSAAGNMPGGERRGGDRNGGPGMGGRGENGNFKKPEEGVPEPGEGMKKPCSAIDYTCFDIWGGRDISGWNYSWKVDDNNVIHIETAYFEY